VTYALGPDGWRTLLPVWAVLHFDRTIGRSWRTTSHVAIRYTPQLAALVIDHGDNVTEVAWANRDPGNPHGAHRWHITEET
jgi:hypothetical protein